MVEVSGPRPTGLRNLLRLRPAMVDFERRGFRTSPAATREVLEAAGRSFLDGFNRELATPVDQAPDLSAVPERHRGFAAEGAAMAATMLDLLNPVGGRRAAALHRLYDDKYVYLLEVGAGWAMAKLRRQRLGTIGATEPLLRWLAYDGMGFCQAFFATSRGLERWSRHSDSCPDTCEIRYQGLGRSLWFRDCGDPAALAQRIANLPARHRADTWSGVALAAAYAGGVAAGAYPQLRTLAGEHHPAVAQGAAFAAEAWRRCGYAPPHAHEAVEELAGVPLERAAEWTWAARRGLDGPDATAADYRSWRQRIQQEAAAIRR